MEYIADRKLTDVENVRQMNISGWQNLSDDEKAQWYTDSKGAINHSDLNRIVANLTQIHSEIEELSGNVIPTTSAKGNWVGNEIPKKAELQAITNYYNELSIWTPFEEVDIDLFRFCTVGKLNNFESLIYKTHKMYEEIKTNGKYKHNLEWEFVSGAFYRTDKVKVGLLDMQALIPKNSTLTINKYTYDGQLIGALSQNATEEEVYYNFEGSNTYLYEFICSNKGAEIYTLGKVGS